jgi:hypothetical protein
MNTSGSGLRAARTNGDIAVAAHVLLNRLAVVAGRMVILRNQWDDLAPETRDAWLAHAQRTSVDASAAFQLLVRGLPLEVSED